MNTVALSPIRTQRSWPCAHLVLGFCVGFVTAGLGAMTPAVAQTQPAVIAVLPLAATDKQMQLYSAPVARDIADRLQKSGLRVESLSLSGVPPQRIDLVIDGRIVAKPAGAVLLEARIRDPERGTTVAAVATSTAAVAELDRLAAELAAALLPKLRAAVTAQRQHSRAEATALTTGTATSGSGPEPRPALAPRSAAPRSATPPNAAPGRSASAAPGAAAEAQRAPAGTNPPTNSVAPTSAPALAPASASASASASAPALLVFAAIGQAAEGVVPVEAAATRAGYQLASKLGYRPVATAARGIVSAKVATAGLREAGARYGLMIEVREVSFSWTGVLMAQGTVRTVLVDTNGRTLYDAARRTGTLVGNRSDRHAALVRFVMAQAVDIFAPELVRALAAHAARKTASKP